VLRQVRPTAGDASWEVIDAAPVGRSGAIRLDDISVSRRHALIRRAAQNGFVVEDVGSANGTYLNGRKLTAPVPIANGDQIGFGDVVVVAEVRAPQAPAPPEGTIVDANGVAPRPAPAGGDDTMAEGTSGAPETGAGRSTERPPESIVIVPITGSRDLGDLAHALADLDRAVAATLESFEQHGGAAAARAFVAQAVRVEANPHNAQDVETLLRFLPSARGMLEAQLRLVELLSKRDSHGGA